LNRQIASAQSIDPPSTPSSAGRKSILQNQAAKDEGKEVEKEQYNDGSVEYRISTPYHALPAFSFLVADRSSPIRANK
jgi:hypothetical protein